MRYKVAKWVGEHPVWTLVIIAGVLRLMAVAFAKGYMAVDDHFLTIEIADGWLNGINQWYTDKPPMRGIMYPYIVAANMWVLGRLSITGPDAVMFFIRLTHGLWSLITIPLIYIAVKRYAGDRSAFVAGLMGAVFFIMPFMSVRNLAEFVCQPVILGGLIMADFALKREGNEKPFNWVLCGILLGLGFMLRFQNSVILIAVFFYLLLRGRWRYAGLFTLGVAVILALETIIDLLSYPGFQLPYVNLLKFQAGHISSYVTNPFYTHFGTILLAFIPPFSFIFVWWVIRGVRKMPVMFWAVLFFLLIHSIIPQKQERFILPILPALIVLGMIGAAGSAAAAKRWMKWLWGWFWTLNTILLIITTLNYSQKARVESLIQLSQVPDLGKVVVINTDHPMNPPRYYLNQDAEICVVHHWSQLEPLADSLKAERTKGLSKSIYLVVYTHKPLSHYLEKIEKQFFPLIQTHHIKPSLVDALLHFMNPEHNHSKEAYIYKWE